MNRLSGNKRYWFTQLSGLASILGLIVGLVGLSQLARVEAIGVRVGLAVYYLRSYSLEITLMAVVVLFRKMLWRCFIYISKHVVTDIVDSACAFPGPGSLSSFIRSATLGIGLGILFMSMTYAFNARVYSHRIAWLYHRGELAEARGKLKEAESYYIAQLRLLPSLRVKGIAPYRLAATRGRRAISRAKLDWCRAEIASNHCSMDVLWAYADAICLSSDDGGDKEIHAKIATRIQKATKLYMIGVRCLRYGDATGANKSFSAVQYEVSGFGLSNILIKQLEEPNRLKQLLLNKSTWSTEEDAKWFLFQLSHMSDDEVQYCLRESIPQEWR